MIKLNIGCGNQCLPGWIGVDRLPPAEIICDLEKDNLPFEDNSVSAVMALYFFEHIDNPLFVMQEIWRVCASGALVEIQVPYWGCESAFRDPTHKKYWTHRTWEYFDSRQIQVPHYTFTGKFDLIQLVETLTPEGQKLEGKELEFAKKHYLNIIYNLIFLLRTIK